MTRAVKTSRYGALFSLFVLTITCFLPNLAFLIITGQNTKNEGIIFDAQLRCVGDNALEHDSNRSSNFSSSDQGYIYHISRHKTESWIHRLVQVNRNTGRLQFRTDVNACNYGRIYPSTFLVYVDIVHKDLIKNPNMNSSFNLPNSIDYISFPLKVIVEQVESCEPVRLMSNNDDRERSGHDYVQRDHINRFVDDIYVSLLLRNSVCYHKSEKLTNIFAFLPASICNDCKVEAEMRPLNYFFTVEKLTGDIVLQKDWCLFEPYYDFQLVLRLKCRSKSDHVIGWDQFVHFIAHRRPTVVSENSSKHPIHRIRREMRNQAPFFDQSLYISSVPEEQRPGISVTIVEAKDPENTPLTFSMTSLLDSRSQAFFNIDSKSGMVSTTGTLDREQMDVHYFRIIATDSGSPPRTGTGTLQINVVDVNDHGPVFEQSSYVVTVREGLSVGSTVISVRATDQDIGKNGEITYSILNVHDIDDAFRIEQKSGVISTKFPLDRESRDEYLLLVEATDNPAIQSDRQVASVSVRVEILDDNDNAPQFSQRSYNVTISENLDASSYPVIARVSATDADEGVNGALRYSIIGGNNLNHFAIDSLTGEISLLKSLDYENGRSYRLNIRAIDNGNPTRSNNTVLLVQVDDLNDNAPKFYSKLFQETVQENIPIGSSVLRIQAFDPDDGENAQIHYRLSFQEPEERFPFEINRDTGWITTTMDLDREYQSSYSFHVVAGDSGNVPLSSTARVLFTIHDLNDNDPSMDPKVYEAQLSEQDPPGTPVATVKAKDPDENSRITYEILEGNVRQRFSISTQNGVGLITIAQPLDFKQERKFVLTVKAIDSGGRMDTGTVYISVVDANTHPPVFENTPYSVKIFEDVAVGTTVLVVSASDQDSGQNAQIVYTLIGENDETDDKAFMVDSNTGAITTVKELDREKVSSYILTVSARDKGIPPMSDTSDVWISLNDVNDNVPEFESEFYQSKVSEDAPVGSSILQVFGTDKDQGKNSMIKYSFSTFSDGDGTFTVDEVSGIIRTLKPLDREQVSRYHLTVLATDQGSPQLVGRCNVTITISDVNDSPPMFESDRIRFFISENSPVGSTVGTIQAWDPDEGMNAEIVYSIVGGVDADSFTLVTHQQPSGASTGGADILTRIEIDYESPRKKFDIIVRAASPPLRNDAHVEIHITDVNDNAPTIQPQFYVILNNYKDNFPIGPIGKIPAIDLDITDSLRYSIIRGNKANLVYLNETTGNLLMSPYLDTNVALRAKMDVLVTDGLNEVRSEMILLTRMITDDLLLNSITVQLAEMTTEAFLSPLFHHFHQALAAVLNIPKENVIIFSIQEELDGTHGVLNVSIAAKKSLSTSADESYFSPQHIKERVFMNRIALTKLSTVEVLPFTDDLCLMEPCVNFEECNVVLKFRNASSFIATDTMLYRSIHPWQTFACKCPKGFSGIKEHYLCDSEINLCFSSPCRNGGTCRRAEGGYVCDCPKGYMGRDCEIELSKTSCTSDSCRFEASCIPTSPGGVTSCRNCSSRATYLNQQCELKTRSFSRGAYLIFSGLRNRYRLNIKMTFATQQRNGLLLYNGRFNERFDFIALEISNSTIRFRFSSGSNVTTVKTGRIVTDGGWHTVAVNFVNKTATVSVDDCDVALTLDHPTEFPASRSCAGRGSEILEERCKHLTEPCQRFLDLTGPLYLGGIPQPSSSFQIETHDFLGCIKNVYINHKFLDLNSYLQEHGTVIGCPQKKRFCSSLPCKNHGKCVDGWGTYHCQCPDGYGQKDCSEDARPVWDLQGDASFVHFTPTLRPVQFPWYNSLSIRTLRRSGILLTVKLSSNETILLLLENGFVRYKFNDDVVPLTLPRVNDGHWHDIEVKWMTAEIWLSLDFGQNEVTIPFEGRIQNLHVTQVYVGHPHLPSVAGCFQNVRIGGVKNYLREPDDLNNVNPQCSLAAACVGALCPPRSTCIEEGGRHKCECDAGHVGENCSPVCALNPCRNNGSCIEDLNDRKGYTCRCDHRFYQGENCEELIDLTCPSTWWGWPVCGPCDCPSEKNFSPDCDEKTGLCKCKEYHYEKHGNCHDCLCYTLGSVSRNCDVLTGNCQCRQDVIGKRCDECRNPFAEVTIRGCEMIYDGCPRSYRKDIWWPRTKFDETAVHDCPIGAIGLASRECVKPSGWKEPDLFNCTSASFVTLLNVVGQLDSGELSLSPLLTTKLARDLRHSLNGSTQLYGNDLWITLRLISHLIQHESRQSGLNLSHRQDKNFIHNLANTLGKITSKEYAEEWEKIRMLFGRGSDELMNVTEKYLIHLTLHQEDTYTRPMEIITPNLVLGLDTVQLTWQNKKNNFEDLVVKSSYDLYETNILRKRAVRFPKYDNIVLDPRRGSNNLKTIIPLDLLGLNDERDMAGSSVVGFIEYSSLFNVLPPIFQADVDRRFNSELIALPPILTLTVLASRVGIKSGKITSPIRLSYSTLGRYLDSSNPQCVVWVEDDGGKGWTALPCQTEMEETYISNKGNLMTVNCTCWHLSTFAVLIENNDVQDVPRPNLVEDIVTFFAFSIALLLIFGSLIALGLLKGPVPSTITNTIHKHLLACLFFALALYLTGLKARIFLAQNDIPCRLVAVGLHFFWLSAFSWLFCSSLHLRRTFTEVRDVNHGSALFYFALGYAFPILCVSMSLGVRAHYYGNKFFCWLSLYEGIVWGMVGPILISVIATLVTFLVAVGAAFTLKDQVVDSGNMRTLLWMDLTLLPICGLVWALCLLGANERSPVWQYAISASVTVLGLYVALGYCVLNQRVKDSLYIRAGGLFCSRDLSRPATSGSRSALTYRSEVERDAAADLRREMIFRGIRSMGVSTASTTSRSTAKTSSSPHRSDGYHINSFDTYNRDVSDLDSMKKTYYKSARKKKLASDEESSDGEQTLELASSHSSDEDEATINEILKSTALGTKTALSGGGSSGRNSGSDNEQPGYPFPKECVAEEKIGNINESSQVCDVTNNSTCIKEMEESLYIYEEMRVNDLSGSPVDAIPPRRSPLSDHYHQAHSVVSQPQLQQMNSFYQLTAGRISAEPPISILDGTSSEVKESSNIVPADGVDGKDEIDFHVASGEEVEKLSAEQKRNEELETQTDDDNGIYGGSLTSGVLV